jgi:hypothetical protein
VLGLLVVYNVHSPWGNPLLNLFSSLTDIVYFSCNFVLQPTELHCRSLPMRALDRASDQTADPPQYS